MIVGILVNSQHKSLKLSGIFNNSRVTATGIKKREHEGITKTQKCCVKTKISINEQTIEARF